MKRMIKYIEGDLLASPCEIICHGVNCQGAMNSGIAQQIRHKYPEIYHSYRSFVDKFHDKTDLLGRIQPIVSKDGSRLIINAFTQLRYGVGIKQVSYDAIDLCFNELNTMLQAKKDRLRIGMPKIGSGLGGGNWSVIESIINANITCNLVEIYTLENN